MSSIPPLMIVYGLVDAAAPTVIRYIGKTTAARRRKRLSLHLTTARKGERTHRANWIRSVLAAAGSITMVVLADGNSDDEACQLERSLIARHRAAGSALTNETDGGEGRPGRRLSADVRAKLSAAAKQLWAQRYARLDEGETFRWGPCPDDRRAKISAGNSGKKRTPEAVAVYSARMKREWASKTGDDRKHSPEWSRHISEALTGKTPTEATRRKMRVSRLRALARERGELAS